MTTADTPPPVSLERHELANGLRVILAPDQSRPVVNLQIFYHVGSKDEQPGRTGFAHLFEHLMFRGSRNVGPEEHMRIVREAGGVVNAYTSFDKTVYWETFPSHYLERMLWLEADRMASLDVSEENFTKEREVVKEEKRSRYDNQPYGNLIIDVLANTYEEYPYKWPVIGSMEDLDAASLADVQRFHRLYYVPNNATLVLAGDFESGQAREWIERYFGPIPRGKQPIPRVTATEPAQRAFREVTKQYPAAPLDAVVSSYKLPPLAHPDRFALEIASSVLSDGQSSRLYRRLVYEEQAAVTAQGQAYFLEGPSLFFGFAIAAQGKVLEDVIGSFQHTLGEMKEQPVSDEELTKAKNRAVAQFITGRQTMQSKADAIGDYAVLHGDPGLINTEIEHYRTVTAGDVQAVCRRYFAAENETRLLIRAGGEQE